MHGAVAARVTYAQTSPDKDGINQLMSHASIMFRFPSDNAARLAFDTLLDLGYDPELHDAGRLHIHVIDEDITSALEICQSHGGELVEQAPAEEAALTNASYSLDCVPIPAHIVNEDWTDGDFVANREVNPDPADYNTFEAR